jgi:hypothetical protein
MVIGIWFKHSITKSIQNGDIVASFKHALLNRIKEYKLNSICDYNMWQNTEILRSSFLISTRNDYKNPIERGQNGHWRNGEVNPFKI